MTTRRRSTRVIPSAKAQEVDQDEDHSSLEQERYETVEKRVN
jgi:hypothetical protein